MATISNTKTAPKFELLLNRNVSVAELPKLPGKLGLSPHKLTKIKRQPSIAAIDEVRSIALFLNIKPIELVESYELGLDKITAREYRQLLKESNRA